jgi:hypothetical protein
MAPCAESIVIGLQYLQLHAQLRRHRLETGIDLRQRRAAIDMRFATAEQVQVRPMQDQDEKRAGFQVVSLFFIIPQRGHPRWWEELKQRNR